MVALPALMRAIVVSLAMVFWTATVVYADEDPLTPPSNPQAFAKLKEGNRLYQLGDYGGAVEAYRAGYLIQASPLFQYNLGQAHRLSENYAEAVHHYKAFLREASPQGELRLFVEDFIKVLTVKQEQEEKAAEEKSKKAQAEEERRRKEAARKGATTPSPAGIPTVDRWYQDGVGWGVLATGLVAAGVGAGLLINGASLRSKIDTEPDQLKAKELRDSADSRQLVGGISAVVGGALILGGITKLAIAPIAPQAVVSTGVDSDSIVVRVGGRF